MATPGQRTRRDAVENDERVLAAAVSTMLRDGRQVPMSAIAEAAGVGVGTLYRKYPNREALLLALTERSLVLLADTAAALSTQDIDGLTQLSRYWDYVIDQDDQLVLPLRGGPSTFTGRTELARRRLTARLRAMVDTGNADGSMRGDVTVGDVAFFGTMLATPLHGAADRRRIARRQKEIHLRGLAGSNHSLTFR